LLGKRVLAEDVRIEVSDDEDDSTTENFALRPSNFPCAPKRPRTDIQKFLQSYAEILSSNQALKEQTKKMAEELSGLKNLVESSLANQQYLVQQIASFKSDMKLMLDNSLSSAIADKKISAAVEQIHTMINRR